jgi:hypothetical protein
VRLPELVVGRQQAGVVLETRLVEQVGDRGALLVVPTAAPDRGSRGVQPGRPGLVVVIRGGRRGDGLREGQ